MNCKYCSTPVSNKEEDAATVNVGVANVCRRCDIGYIGSKHSLISGWMNVLVGDDHYLIRIGYGDIIPSLIIYDETKRREGRTALIKTIEPYPTNEASLDKIQDDVKRVLELKAFW